MVDKIEQRTKIRFAVGDSPVVNWCHFVRCCRVGGADNICMYIAAVTPKLAL